MIDKFINYKIISYDQIKMVAEIIAYIVLGGLLASLVALLIGVRNLFYKEVGG